MQFSSGLATSTLNSLSAQSPRKLRPGPFMGRFGSFNNSMGLMYDPARKLVWAVGQNSHLFALRYDPKTAKVQNLR